MAANLSSDISALRDGLRDGTRRALSRALTLVESTRSDHRAAAKSLLASLAPAPDAGLRIGLSGTPGVGKSTFIEAFGSELIGRGHRVAVLAVDPSSTVTGGSVLGDKTRMTDLVRNPDCFIRPSASGGTLGGVARRTRESILLCEAAGFDAVIVETVGVGQSEIAVSKMTDLFLLLLAPAGGDELQGVKRGVMEIADLVVINKADGDLKPTAERTRADYAAALRLLRRRTDDAPGFPAAVTASAIEGTGVAEIARMLTELSEFRRSSGLHARLRRAQAVDWMQSALETLLKDLFEATLAREDALDDAREAVAQGAMLPEDAADQLIDAFLKEVRRG